MCQTGEQIRVLGSYSQVTVMLGVGLTKVRACYESSIWGFSIKLVKCNEEGDKKKRQNSKSLKGLIGKTKWQCGGL